MDHDEARARILDAAETLFYDRGIQSVGMDELRTTAGVSLKRLYGCFPAKHDLVEAYLRRRDARWRTALAGYVTERAGTPMPVRSRSSTGCTTGSPAPTSAAVPSSIRSASWGPPRTGSPGSPASTSGRCARI